ncbi:MAG: adenylate kinase family protein [Candidatus Odinarchaeota archaeon]
MKILVTGVPATGKTSVSSLLARRMALEWKEINDVLLEKSFYLGYDHQRESYIIDEELTVEYLEKTAAEMLGIVLSGPVLPFAPDFFQLIVVLHANPLDLRKRMLERGYNERKIKENIDAELLSVVLGDAMDFFPEVKLLECNTSELNSEQIVEKIMAYLGNHHEIQSNR